VVAALPRPSAQGQGARATERLDGRIRALQQEAEALAASARTLLGDLRKLEIERDLRAAEAEQAGAALAAARRALDETTTRLSGLEAEYANQRPAMSAQLVELYKHGPTVYAHALFAASDWREFGRAVRAAGATVALHRRRLDEHRRVLDAVRAERAVLDSRAAELESRERDAAAARTTAGRAVKAHAARIAEIDSRRDLTATYVGELQVARDTLLRQLAARGADAAGAAIPVPLQPFRGALEWPAPGPIVGQFGQTAKRLGGTAVRNGIEIASPSGAPVRAIHEGTVAHAGPFTGLGTLVIVDHGRNDYSLYGYLADTSVSVGDAVASGEEIGHVGAAPAGPAALYFEVRIDGRAVDPVQWLQPR
jgi:septal ring factor EnvC (AmiA/AmiB activator)